MFEAYQFRERGSPKFPDARMHHPWLSLTTALALHVCLFALLCICSSRTAQQYYSNLTGHEFTNEVACSRDSHNCETRRLVERRNHTHPVIIRTPPTDLTLFEPLNQVAAASVGLRSFLLHVDLWQPFTPSYCRDNYQYVSCLKI